MTRNAAGLSALELELEEDGELDVHALGEGDEELEGALDDAESDDSELDDHEEDNELEEDHEEDSELEDDHEDDTELDEPDRRGFAERFYELSLRDGESDMELEREVDDILHEMEQEYFLNGLMKRVKQGGKFLFKQAAKYAQNATPLGNVMKIATGLARGDLRGMLGSLAKTALSAAMSHPALAAALPALKALGFDAGNGKLPWGNFVSMAKDAYGKLAQNLDHEAMTPHGASRIAHRSFQRALGNVSQHRRFARAGLGTAGGGKRRGPVMTLRLGNRLWKARLVRVR